MFLFAAILIFKITKYVFNKYLLQQNDCMDSTLFDAIAHMYII